MLRLFSMMILLLSAFFGLLPQLAYGLCWLIARCFRISIPYAPFAWTSLALILLVWVVLAYGFFIGRWRFRTTEWTYEHPDIPAAFDGMRIVHISDLHLSTFEDNPRQLERLVERINATHPDLICFTGDIVSLSLDEATPHIPTLRHLQAKDGICSVLGNHDFFIYSRQYPTAAEKEAAVQQLAEIQRQQLGWHLLRNQSYAISRGTDTLSVIGVDNSNCANQGFHTIHCGDLSKAMAGTAGFRILLSHDPSHWTGEVLPATDIPLTLSGHTHAAQIRLLGWTPASWTFRETDGRYDHDGQTLYINIGLGCTAPIRLGANPEITVITLKSPR